MKKTTTTLLKSALLIAFLCSGKLFAQTYYNVYMSGTATATLQPNVSSGSIVSTDEIIWTNVTTGASTTKTGSSPNLPVAMSDLADGLNSYTVAIKSAAGCLGDPSAAVTLYKLPTTVMSLTTPTVANYCTNASPAASSVIIAEATPASALPAGISYTYTWTADKTVGGSSAGTVATTSIGSHSVSSGSPWKDTFTMNTTTVGVYTFSVKTAYVLSAAASSSAAQSVLKSGSYESVLAGADKKSVEVSPKPTQPTITVL
jgi:hypothetical protein